MSHRILYTPKKINEALSKYGLLYNWYVANDIRKIIPIGWHFPSETEYNTLITNIGSYYAGKKLAETGLTYWLTGTGSNDYLFNARGSSFRSSNGTFGIIKSSFTLWFPNGNDKYASIYDGGSLFTLTGGGGYYHREGYSLRPIKDDSIDPGFIDIDNKRYRTTKIGSQVWLSENLKVTHFLNGDIIPEVTNNSDWAALSTPGLCAHNNDWSNV